MRKWIPLSDSTYFAKRWLSKSWDYSKAPVRYTIAQMKITRDTDRNEITLYTKEYSKSDWKTLSKETHSTD